MLKRALLLGCVTVAGSALAQPMYGPPPPPSEEPSGLPPKAETMPEQRQPESALPSFLVTDAGGRLNRITMGPLPLAFGTLPIEYERAIGDKFSLLAGVKLYYPALGALLGNSTVGGAVLFGGRYFPLQAKAPAGLWAGVELEGSYARTTNFLAGQYQQASATSLVTVGYTFVLPAGWTFSGGMGTGMTFLAAVASTGFGGGLTFAFTVHLNGGYAF